MPDHDALLAVSEAQGQEARARITPEVEADLRRHWPPGTCITRDLVRAAEQRIRNGGCDCQINDFKEQQ